MGSLQRLKNANPQRAWVWFNKDLAAGTSARVTSLASDQSAGLPTSGGPDQNLRLFHGDIATIPLKPCKQTRATSYFCRLHFDVVGFWRIVLVVSWNLTKFNE